MDDKQQGCDWFAENVDNMSITKAYSVGVSRGFVIGLAVGIIGALMVMVVMQ